jgi:hypothetical protein
MNNEFDLQRAIAGEPIETVYGTPMEFVTYRPTAEASKQLIIQVGTDILLYHANGRYNRNPALSCSFDLRMKSVVKQVDWSKMPVDTLVTVYPSTGNDERYFSSFSYGMVNFYRNGKTSKTTTSNLDVFDAEPSYVHIAKNQPWTIWQGGECPIPDGLGFEYMIHGDPGQAIVCTESASAYLWQPKLIYAYRLTGRVLDGWKL